ncbi:MAG TPA: HRDC domain-containing protein, partial [Cellvibrionaceae bacterium]|nr:HRDC domain-containing protein [Cellvibrionaceae bacterium]
YALRACRKRLADSAGVPPYVVFHDSTLKEVMRKKPQNLRQLGLVSGVGDNKLKKYGEEFLAVVKEFT